jgi:hypothetical protein
MTWVMVVIVILSAMRIPGAVPQPGVSVRLCLPVKRICPERGDPSTSAHRHPAVHLRSPMQNNRDRQDDIATGWCCEPAYEKPCYAK